MSAYNAINENPTAPLNAAPKATPGRKILAFGVALALAAVAGYAVGAKTSPGVSESVFAAEPAAPAHTHYELVPVAPYNCPNWKAEKALKSCEDASEFDLCIPSASEKKKPQLNCVGAWKDGPHYDKGYSVYRKVNKKTCKDDPWYDDDDGHKCSSIANNEWTVFDSLGNASPGPRETHCNDEGTGETGAEWMSGFDACRLSCDSCGRALPHDSGCELHDPTFVLYDGTTDGCTFVENAIKNGEDHLSACAVSGNTQHHIFWGDNTETTAFRACGKACGTCSK